MNRIKIYRCYVKLVPSIHLAMDLHHLPQLGSHILVTLVMTDYVFWPLREGFLASIQSILRLREGGLATAGPPCGSFIFLNLGTSLRSKQRPFGGPWAYVKRANQPLVLVSGPLVMGYLGNFGNSYSITFLSWLLLPVQSPSVMHPTGSLLSLVSTFQWSGNLKGLWWNLMKSKRNMSWPWSFCPKLPGQILPRITCRMCLLLLLAFVRCAVFLVEQPSSSLMLAFPYLVWLQKIVSLFWPWLVTRLWATQCIGNTSISVTNHDNKSKIFKYSIDFFLGVYLVNWVTWAAMAMPIWSQLWFLEIRLGPRNAT